MIKLKHEFFNRKTLLVARELLGKYLARKIGNKIIKAKIVETEAYCGPDDLACHASKGLTPRTKVMFGPPGHAYVYMIYGMYHCLNIVTEKEGYPAAVLIRGCELASSMENVVSSEDKSNSILHTTNYLLLNGPGKLCRELKIDKKLNAVDITASEEMWIEDSREKVKQSQIKKSKRIGVDYAGEYKDRLWRFNI